MAIDNTSVLETGEQVYREIQARGLHLRKDINAGRDNTLLLELRARLGCKDEQLMRFLRERGTTAEVFLREFLKIAAPFAVMFKDIWSFLADSQSPDAKELIRVRFGFEGITDPVDLNQFRVWVERTQQMDVTYEEWNEDALQGLFRVQASQYFSVVSRLPVAPFQYQMGEPTEFPAVAAPDDDLAKALQSVRDVFKTIADHAVTDRRAGTWEQAQEPVSRRRATALTDWAVFWTHLMMGHGMLAPSVRDGILADFRQHVEPHLATAPYRHQQVIRQALDMLDLPFWKDRWRTYEIWATVKTFEALECYGPRLRVTDGSAQLDGTIDTVVADLTACDCGQSGFIALQMETPFIRGRRKAIRPDLSVCFGDSKQRAAIVEFKQRAALDLGHASEVGTSYRDGSPGIGGVVLVNYDDNAPVLSEERVTIIRAVRPDHSKKIEEFAHALREALLRADMRPARTTAAVLLDVSSSMGDAYKSRLTIEALRRIRTMPWILVRRFSDSLLPCDPNSSAAPETIVTGGGTNLASALDKLRDEEPGVAYLLIVTDGGYGNADDHLSQLKAWKQCSPDELPDTLDWLVQTR